VIGEFCLWEGFTLVPHHYGRECHERLGGNGVFWAGFCFYSGSKGKRLAAMALIRVSPTLFLLHEARRFLENIATMKMPLFVLFLVSAMDRCLLAIYYSAS
jgi:hypothetical protein